MEFNLDGNTLYVAGELSEVMDVKFESSLADLLEVACYVYAADTALVYAQRLA